MTQEEHRIRLMNTRLNVLEVAEGKSIEEGMERAKQICCDVCKNKLKKLTGLDQCSIDAVGHEQHDYNRLSTNVYVVCQHTVPYKFSDIASPEYFHSLQEDK